MNTAALARYRARRQAAVLAARRSSAAFTAFCFRHEKTQKPIENAPHHIEWHEIFMHEPRFVLEAPVEHGKTVSVAGWMLWVLGKNPSWRWIIASRAVEQSMKPLALIRQSIELNPRVVEVFPHLKKTERDGEPWHTTAITIDRPYGIRDPSVRAVGVGSKLTLGSRAEGIVGDDLLDMESTRNPEQLVKTPEWWDNEIEPRLTDGGVSANIGTPWVPNDHLEVQGKKPGTRYVNYTAVLNPSDPVAKWIPLWQKAFSRERLARIAAGRSPVAFARSYLCQRRSDIDSRFRQEWIDRCKKRDIELVKHPPYYGEMPVLCFTGADVGIGEEPQHNLSSLFTIGLIPNAHGGVFRRVLEIMSGRWTAPELLDRIGDTKLRFNSRMIVESVAAQRFLMQFGAMRGIEIVPYFTNAQNKFHEEFGVESVGVELRAGLWQIPCDAFGNVAPEVEAWIREMLFYTPNSHTGDRLMSSWFAREGARLAQALPSVSLDTLTR